MRTRTHLEKEAKGNSEMAHLPLGVSESVKKRFDHIFAKYVVKAAKSWFGLRNSFCQISELSSQMKMSKKEVERRLPNTSRNSRHFVNLTDKETEYHFSGSF